jgi:hypothetical protein
MKTAMQELIDYLDSIWSNGGWEETIKEKAKDLLEKEKEQMFNLIRFMRTNDKMGKSTEDLYNEFYNK